MADQFHKLLPSRRYLVLTVVLLLALYVLVPQLGDFKSSWQLLSQPTLSWTALALALTGLTYLAGALTYWLLAFKKLHYSELTLIQLAAMFINRLLPGGIGALGVNFLYLRRRRHSAAQAATVVGINNLWGFTGHALLFALTLLIFSNQTVAYDPQRSSTFKIVGYMLLALAVILIVGFLLGRSRFKRWLDDAKQQLLSYRKRPLRLTGALLSSMALTLFNTLCLYACAQAVGVELSLVALLLILSFGVGAGVATPTPGGLGGFEAGLVAGFVAYDVSQSAALAAALLYRLISYWLPLLVGAIAFVVVQKRQLLSH